MIAALNRLAARVWPRVASDSALAARYRALHAELRTAPRAQLRAVTVTIIPVAREMDRRGL